jgi:hypothetical protein
LLKEKEVSGIEQGAVPLWHGSLRLEVAQAVTAVCVQAVAVQSIARAAKSSASFACHARADSVIARCAAIRSSTALRR